MITADFSADFTKFSAAVSGATAELRSFTVDSDKVGAALGRMTDQFSGVRVVQQATLMAQAIENIGGAGNLTTKELARIAPTIQEAIDKAEKMGLEIPDNLRKIHAETQKIPESIGAIGGIAAQVAGPLAALFTVQGVINFGRAVLDAGDAIQKMADQTSLTATEVQKLQYISGQTGTAIETLISAAQDLTLKLGAGNDAGVTAAFRKLRIEADAFTKLDLYEQLAALAKGLQGIKDPTERAIVAADLFGKKWKELTPALLADFAALGDAAPQMSDRGVAATDALGDAFAEMKSQVLADGGTLIGFLATVGSAFDDFLSRFEGDHTIGVSDSEMAAPLERYKVALEAVSPLHKLMISELHMIELSAKSAAAEEKIGTEEVLRSMAANEAAAALAKANAAAEVQRLADLEAKHKAYWDGVLALQDRAYGADALRQASQWADAMDSLNDDVGKLSATMRTELAAALSAALDAMARNGTLTDVLSTRYADLLIKLDAYNASLRVQATVTMPAATGAVTDYTRALYDQAIAEDKLRDARVAADVAAAAAAMAGNPAWYTQALPTGTGGTTGTSGPYTSPTGNQGGGVFVPFESLPTTLPPKRADGGPVSAGRTYLVGERGPELFASGASGAIVPLAGAGGVTVTNTFHIVDTEANLARRVSAAIARSITQARKV